MRSCERREGRPVAKIWIRLIVALLSACITTSLESCSPPLKINGKFIVMSPNYPWSYPAETNCTWDFESNASTSWKLLIPCERLRIHHRLVVTFNETSGSYRSVKLIHTTETSVLASRFRLSLEREDTQSQQMTDSKKWGQKNRSPFIFNVVAWTVAKEPTKDRNVTTPPPTRTTLTVVPPTPRPTPPVCDHAVMANETMQLSTGSQCRNSQWRIKFVNPIRVLKIVFSSIARDYSISTQLDGKQICSSWMTPCPKITFISQAVVLKLNRSKIGVEMVDISLMPDMSCHCATLNRNNNSVGQFRPIKSKYEVGDIVKFVCPVEYSLQQPGPDPKCGISALGITSWTSVYRPACMAHCQAAFNASTSPSKLKYRCAERSPKVATTKRPGSCAWNIAAPESKWISFVVNRWTSSGEVDNNSLIIASFSESVIEVLQSKSFVKDSEVLCRSHRCKVNFITSDQCDIEMTYKAVILPTTESTIIARAKQTDKSVTLTASVLVAILFLVLLIVAAILLIRRSLQRKPYTSPFRHFVRSNPPRTNKTEDLDAEIDISQPNFPPSPKASRAKSSRIGFGRHSLRILSERLSKRLRSGSASIGRRLSMSLTNTPRVFFRKSSATSSNDPKVDVESTNGERGEHNSALDITEQIDE